MITLKNKTTKTECVVTPTIFPDGTSQVWKLPTDVLRVDYLPDKMEVVWHFESEAEVMHLCQLSALVYKYTQNSPDLVIPFLPYGRQDKAVSNDTTFALRIFINVIQEFFEKISTFDSHSLINRDGFKSLDVNDQVYTALNQSGASLVCFPDKGATTRGYDLNGISSFNLEKKRDQSTGIIEGLVCPLPLDLTDKTILLVDDIADGGRTFIESAKLLYSMGAAHVDLYVTHGIFSQGIHILTELGKLRNIYTTDSILRNVNLTGNHPNLTVFKLEL